MPGSEWAIFRLGLPGSIARIEVDTHHFKVRFFKKKKGLLACCHSFYLFYINRAGILYFVYTTRRAPLLISSLLPLGRWPPLQVADPKFDLGSALQHNPTRYCLSHALPCETYWQRVLFYIFLINQSSFLLWAERWRLWPMRFVLFREFSERINSMVSHMYRKHPTTAKKEDYHNFSGVRTGFTPMHHSLA
jgi:hypothetical protein